ncbi:hypothetical protein BS47DRAFT_349720 [Hydnum rufescens UP504]|uniref:Uncharacterized protein n=1 Tax=Hydnum rufescens UP504 TaxID=1448309 RepID=A0A9P6AJN8_9AGAM|nr:hypothetical protein BS47DRAFT_349720 [Hydnum rufescens UP504]
MTNVNLECRSQSCADLCGESFIAADSDHVKASTAYFSDTGMMAIFVRATLPSKPQTERGKRLINHTLSQWES